MIEQEILHTKIVEIMDEHNFNIIEATLEFCNRNDILPEEVVKMMDIITLQRLKKCARDEKMIQKKYLKDIENELSFN